MPLSPSRVAARHTAHGGTSTREIPAGSLLFHGTLESFQGSPTTGFDHVVWFADSPAVAQLYIPKSGLTTMATAETIGTPMDDPEVVIIQQALGIRYDLTPDEMRDAQYLRTRVVPTGWDHPLKEGEVGRLLSKEGWHPDRGFYRFHFSGGKLLAPGEQESGTLFIAKTRKPLRVWYRGEEGGDPDGEQQYLDIKGMKDAEARGLDGVVINDFAQSEEHGNVPHLSVGLFAGALRKLSIKREPAQYQEWGGAGGTDAYPHPPTPVLSRIAGG